MALSCASAPQLLRKAICSLEAKLKGKKKESDVKAPEAHGRIIESMKPAAGAGPSIKVVLIDEGLGNRRNMNYYGPEAIQSAAKIFEGKPCFFNHPSKDEDENLPERSVRNQVGFYKGLKVESLKNPQTGVMGAACTGELHFDTSTAGREAYAKALTALHYQEQFPESPLQYIGFSVLGDGAASRKRMNIDGEDTNVNYVSEFTEADSCDMVTRAGRGGRALVAIAEDINGATEDGMKTLKRLKATLGRMSESAKKAEGDEKARLEEAVKDLQATIKALEDDAKAKADGDKDAEEAGDKIEAMYEKQEGESDEDHMDRLHKHAKALSKLIGADKEEEADADGDDDGDKADDSAKESADSREQRRDAIERLVAESELPYKKAEREAILGMSYIAAKKKIKADLALAESLVGRGSRTAVAVLGGSRVGEGAEGKSRNGAAFRESFNR